MTIHTPVPNFAAARRAMVENQLRPQGVTDHGVLSAMGEIERENFVPTEVRPLAYVDRSLALGGGRFLSPPAVIGQLLTQMAPVRGERALIVGAATGYSAAVLAHIGLDVVALDTTGSPALTGNYLSIEGDLERGYKAKAPYDIILLDGSVEHIPQALIDQLADGGRLGGALDDRGITRLIIGRKAGSAFGYLSIGDAGVAALPGFAKPRTFTF
ncbi:MAG: protein-L-isoaspartate O-methyltransferase family protein [Sphingomicrobium sp.]